MLSPPPVAEAGRAVGEQQAPQGAGGRPGTGLGMPGHLGAPHIPQTVKLEQKRGKPGGQEATVFSALPASGLCFLRGRCHVWLGCPFLFKWDFNSLTGYFFWRDKIANE